MNPSLNLKDEYYGDVHYYNYDSDCWDVSIFPRPRFTSEYGYQSFPSFETLSKVSVASDWSYNSPFVMHRQHHENGNTQISNQLQKHFNLPSSSDSVKKFRDTLFMTQVTSAMCIKTESEHYRR